MSANTQKPNPEHLSALSKGNKALRENNFAAAAAFYLQALEVAPGLSKTIAANLAMTRRRYKAAGEDYGRKRVAVCGWELSHNAAGRVYTLAKLYETFADVEIIGSIFSQYGKDLWEPIRGTSIPVHRFVVEQENRFLEQALELVTAHPYDVVHLSKPRASNIFIGILYKLIWDAQVVVDIDDEELCFVGCDEAISLEGYLKAHCSLPPLKNLDGPDWTRLAVGLAKAFDGVTVSNPALQKKYGGEIVRHARDEKLFQPSPERKRQSRRALGIGEDKKVVLFFGTARAHKGLLETADAIRSLGRGDVVFAIVGDFQEPALKEELLKRAGVEYFFLGNQPFEKIPDIAAAGDYCVLLQDPSSPVAQFQVPAKLSDALGMGMVVLANDLPPVSDLAALGALVTIGQNRLPPALKAVIEDENRARKVNDAALSAFTAELSFATNAPRLQAVLGEASRPFANTVCSVDHAAALLLAPPLSFLLGLLGQLPLLPSDSDKVSQSSPENALGVVGRAERGWSASLARQAAPSQFAERVDVVVPVFNALEDVQKCLRSLQTHKDGFAVRAIVVNDGSDTATSEWLRHFCGQDPMFHLIEHEKNQGYTKAVNTGLKTSDAPYVITQNSDTIVTGGWLQGLIRCIGSDPKIGIAGPLSNAASWQNVPDLYDDTGAFAVNALQIGMSADEMAQIVSASSKRAYPRLPFVNGFCFMIKREVIDAVGFMDEENFPVGYGEENDFCIRAADAGFELAIADDAYVFHAKSKSFGHDKRKELSRQGSDALKRKHTPAKFGALVERVKQTGALDNIRLAIKARLAAAPVGLESVDIMSMRILFLLPVRGGGGGAHSVVQEVAEMRRLGIAAEVAVKKADVSRFRHAYADLPHADALFVGFDAADLIDLAEGYDVVVATVFHSTALLKSIVDWHPHILPAYYIQDYEPLFFEPDSENWILARESYSAVEHAVLFAKTHWIARTVNREHGVTVHKVEPSIDHEAYKPRPKPSDGVIRIAAMIRPQTPRRGADRTMRLFSRLAKAYPGKLAFALFGCDEFEPSFQQLQSDFKFTSHGELRRPEVAAVLAGSDVFIDLSDYQAFGRTALEAMACGCAAMVPVHGGTDEYAVDGSNSIVVDSFDEEECFSRLRALVESQATIAALQRAALKTAARYSPHAAAISELTLFAEALSQHRAAFPCPKKQKMLVLPSLRQDRLPTGSAYVRVLLPYGSVGVRKQWSMEVWSHKELPAPGSAPVALLQREVADYGLGQIGEWLAAWRSVNGRLIYEIDDDLLDTDALRKRHVQGAIQALADKVQWLVTNADLVIVSTRSLEEKIRPLNRNVRVVPNRLDSRLWGLGSPRNNTEGPYARLPEGPLRIGYIGTPTHDQDLAVVAEAMRRIEKAYAGKVEVEVIGAFQKTPPSFGKKVPLPKNTDYPNFVNWLRQRVHWDIGIIPLADDSFNQSKSNLKFLEYAALDMAIVCSDVLSYRDVAVDGVNALVVCNTTYAWESAVSRLIENPGLRQQLAAGARSSVTERHTIDKAVQTYLDVLSGKPNE